MAEEDLKDTTLTNDDIYMLRVLLHRVKGISAVSTANEYAPENSQLNEE